MPDDQIIDMHAIEGLRALSPDDGGVFVRELIEIYLQDTPQRLAELEQALASQDAPAFTRAAHTIKGSSSNFGAGRLTKLAQDIELQGKTHNLPVSAAACAQLKSEYALVAQALAKIVKGR